MQNQLENAEKEGRFAFTAYSILTSAFNDWTLIILRKLFIEYLNFFKISVQFKFKIKYKII